tara:strand:- start:210 stop:317 length:108 start_codon:yes stop_codon:yes gene_type:complete
MFLFRVTKGEVAKMNVCSIERIGTDDFPEPVRSLS